MGVKLDKDLTKLLNCCLIIIIIALDIVSLQFFTIGLITCYERLL